jgi:hypothetical protein
MRYFLDTEYNGFGGALLSLALVPEDGSEEFYVTLDCDAPIDPWVERHVVPFLDMVPEGLKDTRQERQNASRILSTWLLREYDAQVLIHYPEKLVGLEIVADWPEDIAHFCMLLLTGPGRMMPVPPLNLKFASLAGFSTAANSVVPHNALHDARALRDHIMNHLE